MLRGQGIARVACVVVLLLHLIAGIQALLLLPHGFALTDIHLWSNTVVPALAVLVTVVALVRYFFFRSSALTVTALEAATAGGWLVAVVSGALHGGPRTASRSAWSRSESAARWARSR